MSVSQAREAAELGSAVAEPYGSPLEHIADRLKRLDLLMRRETARHTRGRQAEAPVSGGDDARARMALAELERHIARRIEASAAAKRRLPLLELAQIFGLSPIEVDVLVACLAAEIDRKYESIFGYLHDEMGRKLPSAGILLSIFCKDVEERAAARSTVFGPQAPLLRYQLLHAVDDGSSNLPAAGRGLRLDERIGAFLLGDRSIDSRIAEFVSLETVEAKAAPMTPDQRSQAQEMAAAASACARQGVLGRKPIFYLYGHAHAAGGALAQEAARQLGLPLLGADAEQLASSPAGFPQAAFLLLRECLLAQAGAAIRRVDRVLDQDRAQHAGSLFRRLSEMGGVTFLSGERPWSWDLPSEPLALLPVELRSTGYADQLAAWRQLAHDASGLAEEDLHELASKHAMPPADIAGVVRMAHSFAALRAPGEAPTAEDLRKACRSRPAPNLGGAARRVEPKNDWDDLVLPPAQTEQLRALCSQAKRRSKVLGEWGFERKLSLGKGLNALFTGTPGTGKTMAAEVIARELDLSLYKIDLSQTVSKYIGETEKNLSRLFDQAATCRAILFFDEADALLGKRSEVKDAHDRYANTEVAYLLQKIEEYEGVAILATNLRQNMDEAFTRRMGFIVDFPAPEPADRLRIWQRAWPREVPLARDLDLPWLARQFRLAGGNIRNIALASSFLAAEEGGEVSMRHVVQATRRELQKMGRLILEGEPRADAASSPAQARRPA